MRTSWSACATKRLQRTVTWERCFSQAYKKLDVRAMPPHGETPATHFLCSSSNWVESQDWKWSGSASSQGNACEQSGLRIRFKLFDSLRKNALARSPPARCKLEQKDVAFRDQENARHRRSVQSTLQDRQTRHPNWKNGALPDRSRGKTQRQGSTCTSSCSKILLLGRVPKKLLLGSTCWTVF